jgi:hypothetical protein
MRFSQRDRLFSAAEGGEELLLEPIAFGEFGPIVRMRYKRERATWA